MINKSVTLCGALLLCTSNAYAVPLTFGAYAEGGLWGSDATSGGFGATSASVGGSSSNPDVSGTYQAEVAFDPTSYTPILRASSSMSYADIDDYNYRGEAFALQTFTYSGAATTINLNLSLHGIAIDNPDGFAHPYVRGRVDVFGGNIEVVPRSTGTYCSDGIFSQGFSSYICGTDLGSTSGTGMWITSGEATIFDTVSFDVSNGDTFMIHSELLALSFAGSADAMNTFSMSFTGLDAGSLTAASASVSAVPVPAAVWLFGSGLIGLVGVARAKRV